MSQLTLPRRTLAPLGADQHTLDRPPNVDAAAADRLQSPRGMYVRFVKPASDRIGAAAALIALSPVLGAAIAVTRLSLGRPVFYRQERIGQDGRPFTMLKIRTMRPDRRARRSDSFDGQDRRVSHKSANDPRHTRVGRLLRRYSIDELPQLLNVLRGEMSLIGPRPELSDVAARHNLIDHPRHLVKPGVTGLWQISPSRKNVIRDGLHLDERYVRKVGLRTDLRIALATPKAIFSNPGQ